MITVLLKKSEVEFVIRFAKLAEIGGKSNIRETSQDRIKYLGDDQLVGQLGEAALHKYWYGHLLEYARFRWFKNRNKSSGDHGIDIMPFNIDVKGSLLRNGNRSFDNYRLAVRPQERHKDWIYISALVKLEDNGGALVYLMGWETDDNLPSEPDIDGALKGAYTITNSNLKPLMPLRTLWLLE